MKYKYLSFLIPIILVTSGFFWFSKPSKEAESPLFNIVVIGWDGVQWNHLVDCIERKNPVCSEGLKNLNEITKGNINRLTMENGEPFTIPGWVQILTGYNAEVTGVYNNYNFKIIPRGYTVFEKIENAFGEEVNTVFLAGKERNLGSSCKENQPWCFTSQRVDFFENGLGNMSSVGEKAIEVIKSHSDKPFFAFIHFREPDSEGHHYSENSVEYTKSLVNLDIWLKKIWDEIEIANPEEKTFLYVITDHGFQEGGYHHGQGSRESFLATNDALDGGSGDRRDLAPTILEKYKILKQGGSPPLDGKSLLNS